MGKIDATTSKAADEGSGESVTKQLADFIVNASYEDVPEVAVSSIKNSVLDTFGAMLAGSVTSTGDVIAQYAASQGCNPQSSVVGFQQRTTPALAALANGTMGHALELDDYSRTTQSHPANPLTAAIMAIGQVAKITGNDVILAFAVGWEVQAQLSKAIRHAILDAGWHNQGFQVAMGAAAACAKLRSLDLMKTRMTLGLAASMCSGFHINRGSDTKPFHAGNAARTGVTALDLVSLGFTANADVLDGPIGFCRVLGGAEGDPRKVLNGLGTWDLATVGSSLKPFACCGGSFWAMEAVQEIMREHPFTPEQVESVECHVPRGVLHVLPYQTPSTGLEAKFSLEYGVATMIIDGKGGIEQYSDAAVQRKEVQELMRRVKYVFLPGISDSTTELLNHAQRVVVTLKTGEKHEASIRFPKGTLENPLSADEIAEKFDDCSRARLSPETQKRVREAMQELESIRDVNEIMELLEAPS